MHTEPQAFPSDEELITLFIEAKNTFQRILFQLDTKIKLKTQKTESILKALDKLMIRLASLLEVLDQAEKLEPRTINVTSKLIADLSNLLSKNLVKKLKYKEAIIGDVIEDTAPIQTTLRVRQKLTEDTNPHLSKAFARIRKAIPTVESIINDTLVTLISIKAKLFPQQVEQARAAYAAQEEEQQHEEAALLLQQAEQAQVSSAPAASQDVPSSVQEDTVLDEPPRLDDEPPLAESTPPASPTPTPQEAAPSEVNLTFTESGQQELLKALEDAKSDVQTILETFQPYGMPQKPLPPVYHPGDQLKDEFNWGEVFHPRSEVHDKPDPQLPPPISASKSEDEGEDEDEGESSLELPVVNSPKDSPRAIPKTTETATPIATAIAALGTLSSKNSAPPAPSSATPPPSPATEPNIPPR